MKKIEVKELENGLKEIEVKCTCGRKLKIKFIAPVIVEQTSTFELRGEDSL